MWGATIRTKGGSKGKESEKSIERCTCWGLGACLRMSSISGESSSTLERKRVKHYPMYSCLSFDHDSKIRTRFGNESAKKVITFWGICPICRDYHCSFLWSKLPSYSYLICIYLVVPSWSYRSLALNHTRYPDIIYVYVRVILVESGDK